MKIICMFFITILIGSIFAKPLNLDSGNCPSPSLPSFNKKFCDYFVNDVEDFINAESYCANLGGHLISFHNIFDNMDITDKAKIMFPNNQEFATGGNKLMDPSNWTWIDDTVLNFTNWAQNEPVSSSTRNCLQVNLARGLWYTSDCFDQVPFVCRVPAPPPPSTTTMTAATVDPTACPSPSLSSFNKKSCDYFVDDFEDFINAEGYCTNLGGHLISFHSIFDNLDVTDKAKKLFLTSAEFATGGNRLLNPSNWSWVDSTVVNFTDWAPGEPVSSSTRNCLHVDLTRGLWYASDCYAKVPFVCRVPAPTPPSTTTTTTTSTTTPVPTTTTTTTTAIPTTTTSTTTTSTVPTTTTSTTTTSTTTTNPTTTTKSVPITTSIIETTTPTTMAKTTIANVSTNKPVLTTPKN